MLLIYPFHTNSSALCNKLMVTAGGGGNMILDVNLHQSLKLLVQHRVKDYGTAANTEAMEMQPKSQQHTARRSLDPFS